MQSVFGPPPPTKYITEAGCKTHLTIKKMMFHVTVKSMTVLSCSNIVWPNERSNVLWKWISGGYISKCQKKWTCLDNCLDKNCFGTCICTLPWGLLEKIHHCCSWLNEDICRYIIINFKVLCKKGVALRANLVMVSCCLLN